MRSSEIFGCNPTGDRSSPVCDRTDPHWLVSLYHPPARLSGRCRPPTNQLFFPMELGFPNRGGRCRPERTRFYPPVGLIINIWIDPWTGDGTLASPGDAGSTIYEPRPYRDRPVGGIANFHTVREVSIVVIYRVRSRVVGVV